ncbi:ABC transporter permease subunit [Paenibacillus sp. LMG 31458]|uniref:ABC transporter permease subunit n=2 Tax=Paenibacillus TaxID=44249 RepID=A0ABX1Z263_9BACL|nr:MULTISPECIES: carbohydrate ABC transporter permease [Paenibacillus]NOU75206.1 ABC transporter permease subunit [Paenibacillus phytorum]NOU85985.1 ABC transporter permease subunit [Paenibacillus germinis]
MKTIKRSKEDLVFDIINYSVLGFFLLIVLYPLYFVFIASISSPNDVVSGNVIMLPKGITLEGYERIFKDTRIWTGYGNTILYTVVGTTLNVILTMMIGFPLSRKYFSGRKVIMIVLMITMYFSGGLIPHYLLVKSLGLRDTAMAMVILGAVGVFNIIITRSFLESNISEEIEQAAAIDGCSPFRFFISMVLPLSKSVMAVLALYYGVGHWNDYFKAMIFLNSSEKFPLQLILRSILIQSQNLTTMTDDITQAEEARIIAEQIKYGVIIIASVPMLFLYPFLQRYFIKGVMVGSIKG